jgi:Tfp pilus assembly protein FimT
VTAIQEDAVNNSGSLVSSFLSSSDVDASAVTGIAVTANDNSHGNWQFSTDGGANWVAFGTTSDAAARLLRTDKIRFVPAADYAGTATITYRAWDRTSGTAGPDRRPLRGHQLWHHQGRRQWRRNRLLRHQADRHTHRHRRE